MPKNAGSGDTTLEFQKKAGGTSHGVIMSKVLFEPKYTMLRFA